jgi:hypothetical protein
MEYIKVSKAAEKWGISTRRVRVLCAEGKIPGSSQRNLYMIPKPRKAAGRRRTRAGVLAEVEAKRERLNRCAADPRRGQASADEFMIEFTYKPMQWGNIADPERTASGAGGRDH